MKKRLLALVLAAALLALSGCSLVEVNQERDYAQVVAKVNGEEITKGEIMGTVYYYAMIYGYDMDDPAYADEIKSIKESVLESAIQEKLILQKADASGFDEKSEAVLAKAREKLDEQLDAIRDTYRTQAEAEKEKDPDLDVEAYVEEKFQQYLKNAETTEEDMLKNAVESVRYDMFYEHATQGQTASEQEVQQAYDKLVEDQKAAYAEDLTKYISQTDTIVYRPAGYRYVKHILLAFDSEKQEYLAGLQKEDEEAFKTAADEAAAGIADKVKEVQDKLAAGGDFDELIQEYSDDTAAKQDDDTVENGMLVCEGAPYVEPFLSVALGLKNVGDISDPTVTAYGVHFILFASEVQEEVLPYEDVKEEIREGLDNEKKSAYWEEQVKTWKEEATVKTYKNRL